MRRFYSARLGLLVLLPLRLPPQRLDWHHYPFRRRQHYYWHHHCWHHHCWHWHHFWHHHCWLRPATPVGGPFVTLGTASIGITTPSDATDIFASLPPPYWRHQHRTLISAPRLLTRYRRHRLDPYVASAPKVPHPTDAPPSSLPQWIRQARRFCSAHLGLHVLPPPRLFPCSTWYHQPYRRRRLQHPLDPVHRSLPFPKLALWSPKFPRGSPASCSGSVANRCVKPLKYLDTLSSEILAPLLARATPIWHLANTHTHTHLANTHTHLVNTHTHLVNTHTHLVNRSSA